MAEVYHALGLNMHQPLGNLLALHNSDERWEARQILWCYDRPTRIRTMRNAQLLDWAKRKLQRCKVRSSD